MARPAKCAIVSGVVVALLLLSPGVLGQPSDGSHIFGVREFGAKGDGAAKDTAAVQSAIDVAATAKGGTVWFPAGVYTCGSLHLRSNVTLWLGAGATILGSKDNEDYDPYERIDFKNDADRETSFFHNALIWGEDVENIAIMGQGVIDSNRDRRIGPKAIALKRCRFVEIRDIRLQNCPNYNISLLGTDFVNIDGVTILNGYADGIDPDSCRNVRISNCHIESFDDAIVPKTSFSLGERRACENITVTNCYLASACNTFKLGTESGGDFKRIAVSNCVMSGLNKSHPADGGICLESVDGSHIDGVVVSNITMTAVRAPIFIRLGNRGRDMETPVPGSLQNVSISNIVATGASQACSITGIPEHSVKGAALSDIRIDFDGGCPYLSDQESVPEQIKEYPDAHMFGALPVYGFYCRHVEDLTISNMTLTFAEGYWRLTDNSQGKINWESENGVPSPSEPGNPSHAMVFDDVAMLSIDGLRARVSPKGEAAIRLINVHDASLRGCVTSPQGATLVTAAGHESTGIRVRECDTGQTAIREKGLPTNAMKVDD